ncbi:DUF4214 domain-containing protein [Actinotalea sp. C106]|uniref:DUF4214 domain-containing protein n=1 Tax=Actinotalea sp. C106 TaxID=2908644 RepID=UPI002027A2CB|nr:DUF4214 domain-containing protein [Actinotalea sp. C106]
MRDETHQTARRPAALRGVLAGVLTAVVGVSTGITAHAADGGQSVVTVDGTAWTVFVDAPHPHREGPEPDHADHADHASDSQTVVVLEVDDQLYELAAGSPLEELPSGSEVTLTLELDPGEDELDALEALGDGSSAEASPLVDVVVAGGPASGPGTDQDVATAEVTGSRTLTVLPVHFGTPDPAATQAKLGELASSTATYWRAQSGGQLSLQTSVRGWQDIGPVQGCDYLTIMSKARAAHGVSAEPRHHVVVYFPERTSCGWAGLGSVGGSLMWVNGLLSADVFAHEFGHNLGLGHANTATCTSGGRRVPLVRASSFSSACVVREYADLADVMGAAFVNRPTGNLSTGLADHLGYAQVRRVSATSGVPVTVDLAPLASTSALRALSIDVPAGRLYVSFRPAAGRDVRVPEWAGVQVHLRRPDRIGAPETVLLDMQPTSSFAFSSANLPQGGTWTIPDTDLALTVARTGTVARVTVGPAVGDPAIERYVTTVYLDLFGRGPDARGLATWTSALQSGAPRAGVANSITGSNEYRGRLIRESYRQFLGREADPHGLASWLRAMRRGGTIQQMEAGFLASNEYYVKAGGSSAGWIRELYGDVLGRTPTTSEVRSWQARLGSGSSRRSVAMGFLLSTEYLSTVVEGHYQHLLGRGLDTTGRRTWVSKIQRGTRTEAVIAGIVASNEYYRKA